MPRATALSAPTIDHCVDPLHENESNASAVVVLVSWQYHNYFQGQFARHVSHRTQTPNADNHDVVAA